MLHAIRMGYRQNRARARYQVSEQMFGGIMVNNGSDGLCIRASHENTYGHGKTFCKIQFFMIRDPKTYIYRKFEEDDHLFKSYFLNINVR